MKIVYKGKSPTLTVGITSKNEIVNVVLVKNKPVELDKELVARLEERGLPDGVTIVKGGKSDAEKKAEAEAKAKKEAEEKAKEEAKKKAEAKK